MAFLIAIVAVALVAWLVLRSKPASASGVLRTSVNREFVPPAGQHANLGGGDGSYAIEVVGESHYQPSLRAVAGKGEVRHECGAELEMEDDNEYDKNAVLVTIEGRAVGHLSRADAKAYRRQVKGYGDIVGCCPAVIIGGGKGRSLGVWLDLPGRD